MSSHTLYIYGNSRLIYEGDSTELSTSFQKGNAAGLMMLAQTGLSGSSDAFLFFFRDFTKRFLLEILHAEPMDSDVGKEADSAPPASRGQIVTKEFLLQIRTELADWLRERAELEQLTIPEWIRQHLIGWSEIGKVGFHLAENKADRDGTKPFAFLATYVHGLTERGTPRHLPLKQALAKYSGDAKALLNFLEPIRLASEKSEFLKKLSDSGALFRPSLWSAETAWRFLKEVPFFQECGIFVRMTEVWKKTRPKLHLEIAVDLQRKKGQPLSESLVRFSVQSAIGDQKLSPEEMNAILNTKGGLIRIKGEWVEADTERIAKLMQKWSSVASFSGRTGIPFLQSMRILAGAGALNPDQEVPFMDADPLCSIQTGDSLKTILSQTEPESWKKAGDLPEIPKSIHAELRLYQKQGVRFLEGMSSLGLGACLADDMGLGKTLQVLTFLEIQREKGLFRDSRLPALIVMPASLLENWRQEAQKFAPELRFGILHNAVLSGSEKEILAKNPERFFGKYDALALSYAAVSRLEFLRDFEFPAILLDEAQFIKNASSGQSKAVRTLRGKIRIAMTGTPVENNLGDLWSLFDFIQPGLLGNGTAFRSFIHSMESGRNGKSDYTPLRKLVRPYILRRLKSDKSIISDLPDKCECKTYCSMTAIQTNFYLRCVEEMKRDLAIMEGTDRNGIVLGYLSQFKQICNHPSQFSGNNEFDPNRSGKFLRLKEITSGIAQNGEKVLIFTQYKEMTEPLHDFLAGIFGRTGLILHGGTPLAERARSVQEFQDPAGPPFFVLSLKAAGTGLNLTAAGHVIHFDRWWNPAVENQATDRAYRIGQHRNVLVHKFITKGTLEEKIDSMIAGKTYLSNSILSKGPEKSLLDLSNQELLDLVKLEKNLKEDPA